MSTQKGNDMPTFPPLATPAIGAELSAALADMKPTPTRRPHRELAAFLLLSLPFVAVLVGGTGLRSDLAGLALPSLILVAAAWTASFLGCAYLAFVPPGNQVTPNARRIVQAFVTSLLALVAIGFLIKLDAGGRSVSYEPSVHEVLAHAGGCAMLGLMAGVVPGLIVLALTRRFVPVGRASMGLSLGAAGGALAGVFLLFHCPVAEPFHLAMVHTSGIASAALVVALAGWLLLRER